MLFINFIYLLGIYVIYEINVKNKSLALALIKP